MSKSAHSLVSDVTPWWWETHWGKSEVRRAVGALLVTQRFAIEHISISRAALSVQVSLGTEEDANRAQERLESLREALGDLVPVG